MIYIIFYDDKKAKLFLSFSEGSYVASILYFIKSGSWSNKEDVIVNIKIENFLGQTEKEALEKAKNWFSNNITEKFDIEEATDKD